MRVEESRPLTEKERSLIERLLRNGVPESRNYIDQLPQATVASRCGCGCPTIDLAVGGRVASHRSPTVILAEAGGVSPEGISFGIILHSREGLLSELEFYPIDGEGAFTMPAIESIRYQAQR